MAHNFADTPVSTCHCLLGPENSLHFLLKCPDYNNERCKLFELVNPIVTKNDLVNLSDPLLVELLLYGNTKNTASENKVILKATIDFINKTGRFDRL